MNVGERIKLYRKKRGMTQWELGAELGTGESMIRAYESGRRSPKPETLERLAAALNVESGDLSPCEVRQLCREDRLIHIVGKDLIEKICEFMDKMGYDSDDLDDIHICFIIIGIFTAELEKMKGGTRNWNLK